MQVSRGIWGVTTRAVRLALYGSACCAGVASAQVTTTGVVDEVLARARPEYNAIGVPVGAFRLYPKVETDISYDDNIYNSNVVARTDEIVEVAPTMLLQSDWTRHSLRLDAGALFQRFLHYGNNNNDQYHATLTGTGDISRDASFEAALRYAHTIEPRGTAGDVAVGGTPTKYDDFGSSLSGRQNFGRIGVRLGGSIDKYSYQDGEIDGVRISQRFRDHYSAATTGELSYEISPAINLFGKGLYNWQRYDITLPGSNFNAEGYAVLGGVNFEITRVLGGSVSAGYLHQAFEDPRFSSINGLTYNASVIWNPTTLLSVTFAAARSIQQSPLIGISGILTDTIGVSANYELLRNFIITPHVAYNIDDYKGINRRDHRISTELDGRYLFNQTLSMALHYDRRNQSSTGSIVRPYTGNTFRASIIVQR